MIRLLLFSFLLAGCFANAQSFKADSSFLTDAKKYSIELYSKSLSPQSHLYNGSAYTEYKSRNGENPYFIDDWLEGTVEYDGDFYQNIPLLYDISRDKLILDNQYSINKVQLISEKINRFTIQNRVFVHLIDRTVPNGFYELTYDGTIKVYIRYVKNLQSKAVDYSIESLFEEKTSYYLVKDDRFISVKSKGSVLNVLEDKKTELKKFIRDNHLAFKADRVRDITRVVQYYDELKK